MRTISLDLRERILATYDHDEGTRDDVARRFRVSLGLVKKLLQQRRHTGDIAPRHRFSGPQTDDCRHPPEPSARFTGQEKRSDPPGTTGRDGTEVFLAGH